MPLVLFHTDRVRQALRRRESIGIDLLIILSLAGLIAALASLAGHLAAPRPRVVEIDLSLRRLPLYAFYSLSRAFAAYAISLLFTLVYGTISAHNRLAEKFMLPVLDILQSLPVLTFLPGIVLLFVRLFPSTWLGLELACVVTLFTAQAWNMTFSYHGSVRAIPDTLREASSLMGLSGWQIFKYLEVPASMIGLVWNSMMSMAGGWFFITIEEAVTIGGRDYRLPGIGSYMNQAQEAWNIPAMIAGVAMMVLIIVAVDQLFWRPIVVWSQRFKLEDTAAADVPTSWVLNLFGRSGLIKWIARFIRRHRQPKIAPPVDLEQLADLQGAGAQPPPRGRLWRWAAAALKWIVLAAVVGCATWGAWMLVRMLLQLPLHDYADATGARQPGWITVLLALLASLARTSAAVLIGGLWALPAGILIGLSPRWANRLQPIVQVVASFPAPMIFPLAVFAFLRLHIPFTIGCVSLMLLGTQWYILFNVIAGAMAIPSQLREAAAVFHLPLWQRWIRSYIPAVFPYLLTGLITAAGGAWNATIVAEYFQLYHRDRTTTTYEAFGLGSLIYQSTTDGNWPLAAASAVAMALAVVSINRFFWRRLYRLAEERFALNV